MCFFFLEIHVVFVVTPRGRLLGDLRRRISFSQSDEEKALKITSGASFVISHPKEGEGPRKKHPVQQHLGVSLRNLQVIAALEWKGEQAEP